MKRGGEVSREEGRCEERRRGLTSGGGEDSAVKRDTQRGGRRLWVGEGSRGRSHPKLQP